MQTDLLGGLTGPMQMSNMGMKIDPFGQTLKPGLGSPNFISDTRDRTLTDPYEIGGGGMLGVSSIDGSGGGALFLPDENRPRSEEEIRNRYEQAKADAARQRAAGFMGQVVLPGEQTFEEFKRFTGNTFFLKRNPNIPESAYGNFDLSNVGGFDNSTTDDASMKGLPETNEPPMFATNGGPTAPSGSATPQNPFNKTAGIGSLQPYQNQFKDFEKRLENIEQGVGSLLNKNQMYMSNNMGVQGYSSTGYSPNSVIGNLLKWSYR